MTQHPVSDEDDGDENSEARRNTIKGFAQKIESMMMSREREYCCRVEGEASASYVGETHEATGGLRRSDADDVVHRVGNSGVCNRQRCNRSASFVCAQCPRQLARTAELLDHLSNHPLKMLSGEEGGSIPCTNQQAMCS